MGSWLAWKFRQHHMYWHWGYWVCPQACTRLNGGMYGYNPYRSYRIGPFEYRRYL